MIPTFGPAQVRPGSVCSRQERPHGPACLLEGLSQSVVGFVPDRALSGRVELGASFVQPDQQKDRKQAEAAARRRRNRRDGRKGGHWPRIRDWEGPIPPGRGRRTRTNRESTHTIEIDSFVPRPEI